MKAPPQHPHLLPIHYSLDHLLSLYLSQQPGASIVPKAEIMCYSWCKSWLGMGSHYLPSRQMNQCRIWLVHIFSHLPVMEGRCYSTDQANKATEGEPSLGQLIIVNLIGIKITQETHPEACR